MTQHIELIDIVQVDDVTFADAHVACGFLLEIVGKHLLHGSQIHAYRSTHVVGHQDVCIVAVGLEAHNLRDINTQQFVARIEIEPFLCHGSPIFIYGPTSSELTELLLLGLSLRTW